MDSPVFRYPIVRCFSFSTIFLLADLIISLTFWFVHVPEYDVKESLEAFDLRKSVFDLVCISFGRCMLMLLIKGFLETMTISAAQLGVNNKCKRKFLTLLGAIILLGSLTFVIVKDVFVHKKYKEDPNYMKYTLHKVLCILALIFSVIHILVFILFLKNLRKLHTRYYVSFDESGNGEPKKREKSVNLKRLMKLALPEKWILFLGTIGLIGSTSAQMLAPLYFGKVIQSASMRDMSELNYHILILFSIYMFGSVCSLFRSWLYTLAGQSIVARLRKMLFDHIIHQEIAFFDTSRTGELMNRLSSDSQVIQNALSVNISMLLRYALQIIGSIIIMLITSPKLGGLLLVIVPLVGIGAQRYGAFTRTKQRNFQDELATSATSAEEVISSMRTVRSFSQENKASKEYGSAIDASYKLGKQLALASGFFNLLLGVISQGAIVLVLWYGGKLVHDGDMNVGVLTSFILYALNVAMAFAFLSSLYGDFMKAVGASVRIFEIFDRNNQLPPGDIELPNAKVEISFDNVLFNYPARPDNPVLKNITFSMLPGDTIALVGPSGGGKSTVICLLERFYDPLEGQILIGGYALPKINTDWFRKRVGIVSQEPVLFATTIYKNIAYGIDATEEQIQDAAKQANAHDFIVGFEEGYETNVGERGVKLSGGQKQRIAIARALLLNPDILLLDEATSALDAESEFLVQEAIDRAMVGRTVLVIAHRLSTVRDASKVLVINKGKIVEQGTHDELIEFNGVYKRLVLRQLEKGAQMDDSHDNSEDEDIDDDSMNLSPAKHSLNNPDL